MRQKIRQIHSNIKSSIYSKDENALLGAGIIFFLFSIFTAGFNYLYHLFMGRMLGPEDYGILGSLFAIIYIASFSTQTFNLVIAKQVAEFEGKNQKGKIKNLFYAGFKKTVFFGFIGLGIYLLLTPFIADFMKIQSYSEIIIVGITSFFLFLGVLFTGILNGLQKFFWQNNSSFVSIALKFLLAVLFVFIGFKINGALAAILLGTVAGIIIAYIPIKSYFKNIEKQPIEGKKIYLYAVPVFFASMFFIFLITFDQILVKHYFSSSDAGIYAAAGMIGKMIWFGSSFLISPLFPKLVSLKSKGKDTSKLLSKAIFYTTALVILGCLVFYIAPTFIVTMLYGQAYVQSIPLILMFGISLGIYSIIQIFMTYNLAIEKYSFIYMFAVAAILEVLGIYMFHNTLVEILKVLLITNIFVLASFLIINRNDLIKY